MEADVSVFPAYATGLYVQHPFISERHFDVTMASHDSGQCYVYRHNSGALAKWDLSFEGLTGDEANVLIVFHSDMRGAWDYFSFTDPDTAVTHTTCRFAAKPLAITYAGPNDTRIQMTIEEFR